MASAGRILILPKGNWSAETEYEMLDLVFNAGASWVARKRVVGVEPTEANEEYWMKMCEGANLVEVYQRLSAIEEQLISTISLDDIDLSPYALKTDLSSYATKSELSGYAAKSELSSYATKSELNSANSNITSLDSRLDVAEPKITSLTSDLNTAKTNISNLQTKVNGLPTSAKSEVKTYVGTGTSGPSYPCSVTFNIVPKVVVALGWRQASNNHQVSLRGLGARYCTDVMFCEDITTSFAREAGFLYCESSEMPNRYAKKSSDGKTISWYIGNDNGNPHGQLNTSGNTYYILGIG